MTNGHLLALQLPDLPNWCARGSSTKPNGTLWALCALNPISSLWFLSLSLAKRANQLRRRRRRHKKKEERERESSLAFATSDTCWFETCIGSRSLTPTAGGGEAAPRRGWRNKSARARRELPAERDSLLAGKSGLRQERPATGGPHFSVCVLFVVRHSCARLIGARLGSPRA